MQRNKSLAYDEDDLYPSDDDNYGEEEEAEYTEEDKSNFATLTPVVRAEVEEAGLQASDREIEDALWNYYWDVAKSVAYLKNVKQPKKTLGASTSSGGSTGTVKKAKAGSKFEEAAARSNAATAGTGELSDVFLSLQGWRWAVKEGGGSRSRSSSETGQTGSISQAEDKRRGGSPYCACDLGKC